MTTIHSLLFDIDRSIRYHERRMAFYDNCRIITNVLTMIISGAVIFDVFNSSATVFPLAQVILGLISAGYSLMDLTLGGYGKHADNHKRLRRRFSDLKRSIIASNYDQQQLSKFEQERLLIETDEPPIYVALDSLCHNEQLIADGYTYAKNPKELASITTLQKLTSNLYRWPNLNPRKN